MSAAATAARRLSILNISNKSDSKPDLSRKSSMRSSSSQQASSDVTSASSSTSADVTKMTEEEKARERLELSSCHLELATFQTQFTEMMSEAGDDMMKKAALLRETTPLRLYLEQKLQQTQKNVDKIDELQKVEKDMQHKKVEKDKKRKIAISSRIRKVWAIDQVTQNMSVCHGVHAFLFVFLFPEYNGPKKK